MKELKLSAITPHCSTSSLFQQNQIRETVNWCVATALPKSGHYTCTAPIPKNQKHFLCTIDGPDSSYSALAIHICIPHINNNLSSVCSEYIDNKSNQGYTIADRQYMCVCVCVCVRVLEGMDIREIKYKQNILMLLNA